MDTSELLLTINIQAKKIYQLEKEVNNYKTKKREVLNNNVFALWINEKEEYESCVYGFSSGNPQRDFYNALVDLFRQMHFDCPKLKNEIFSFVLNWVASELTDEEEE